MSALIKHTPLPDRPPPSSQTGIVHWAKQHLFSSTTNSLLTLASFYVLFLLVPPLVNWALLSATLEGTDRSACEANGGGACWTFIKIRFNQIMFGLYYGSHPEQIWRPVLAFFMLIGLVAPLFIERFSYKGLLAGFILLIFPFIAFALIHGAWLGLPVAETNEWGGFMLTFILSIVGIIAALPLGILLALGRRSELPVVRSFCVFFIELWRGTPLITVLFMASVLLPLFFPSGVDLDKVLRALIGITLFQSAYTAEAIRGGLQAIPKGQFEAADALGLAYWEKMTFIILPQALKISIPGIVNTFIELFKDTTLVSIIGLLDLLNMSQTAAQSAEWRGYDTEAYIFAAFIFWIFCYGMSRYSQNLETKLDRGHKN
ncbi:MAG: amino acid ABC transporter permease [Hyphomicrobiaceae bacterium]|nr:amino acid ABC transporter permease [Hyphomicrobiaceae bacterium]